ncbi:asparaginase, partial [Acinetobacter baumannii]|nr:asparaginase [Acinetobacter baumannii]
MYFFLRLFILRLSTTNLSDAMQKKSIYVAYTGGTIGMQRS